MSHEANEGVLREIRGLILVSTLDQRPLEDPWVDMLQQLLQGLRITTRGTGEECRFRIGLPHGSGHGRCLSDGSFIEETTPGLVV